MKKDLPFDVAEEQMKRVEAIIQSMTAQERRRPDVLNASRKRRIAAGSGTSVQEINTLLRQFRDVVFVQKEPALHQHRRMSHMRNDKKLFCARAAIDRMGAGDQGLLHKSG